MPVTMHPRGNRMSIRVLLSALLAFPLLGLPLSGQAKPEDSSIIGLSSSTQHGSIAQWVSEFLSVSDYSYTKRPLDDELSADIFERYLDALDGERLFFMAGDIAAFERYRTSLDDAIEARDLRPAFDIYNVYSQRLAERTAFARAFLAAGEFDLDGDQTYRLNRDEGPWEPDAAALDAVWRQRVSNDVLRLKLAGRKMEGIIETLDKRYASGERRLQELKADDVVQSVMTAYAGALEAHTSYMDARTAENFNIQMRLSLEGIGAVLQRDDEFTLVRSIVPGGPAALSGKIKVGDRIVAVGQGKSGPMVEVVGWRVDDVVKLIRGPKNSWVRLDILPAEVGVDGKHELVSINRQKIKLEEQAAKQRIIEVPDGETTRRVGVISLPGFYEDFEGRRRDEPDYRSATRDVARLLVELKEAKVEGVVLDLRNNGGGSLREAVELTGLFIDAGPVVQVRYAGGRVQVEQDRQLGTTWDGPLAVLVNRASASASEIVAAAIQHHGRGLIIGETTFGKGTVQNLLDLDSMYRRNESPGLGQLKLTVAQFFRVNGGSTQRKGVEPDLLFPQTLDDEDYGESTYDNALPWSQISSVPHNRLAVFEPLLPLLHKRHSLRTEQDPEFRWLKEDIALYREQRGRETLSLNLESRKQERDALEARRKQREAERKALGDSVAEAAILTDDGLQANERELSEQLKREEDRDADRPDAMLREAVNVLVDAIDLLRSDRKLAALVYPQREQLDN